MPTPSDQIKEIVAMLGDDTGETQDAVFLVWKLITDTNRTIKGLHKKVATLEAKLHELTGTRTTD